jgi:hypothetical protein
MTVCPSWIWLSVSRSRKIEGFANITRAFVATLPLLFLLPLAGMCLLRISF